MFKTFDVKNSDEFDFGYTNTVKLEYPFPIPFTSYPTIMYALPNIKTGFISSCYQSETSIDEIRVASLDPVPSGSYIIQFVAIGKWK